MATMVLSWRLVLPCGAFPSVFEDDFDVGFSNKAGACVSFAVDPSFSLDGEDYVVKIVGTQAQQEAACRMIFCELCNYLGFENLEDCMLMLVIPSKAVEGVLSQCHAMRSSVKVDVEIFAMSNSKNNSVVFRLSRGHLGCSGHRKCSGPGHGWFGSCR